MTISVVQSGFAYDTATPFTHTWAQAPAQGNLLIAIVAERSGAEDLSMADGSWTKVVGVNHLPLDTSWRKTHAVWWKIAGASEPLSPSVTITQTGTSTAMVVGLAEFEGTTGELSSLSFATAIATAYDTAANVYSSGTTVSVASANKLLIGCCYTKVGAGSGDNPLSDWSTGADPLTEFTALNQGSNLNDVSWAWGTSTSAGTHEATARIDDGTTSSDRGAIVSLLVFDLAGSTPAEGTGTGAYAFDGSTAGTTTRDGSATQSFDFSGSATGTTPLVSPSEGTAAGAYDYSATAAGLTEHVALASGGYNVSGSVTGAATPQATAAGGYAYTGSALAEVGDPIPRLIPFTLPANEVTGSATGAYAHTGSATGQRTSSGVGTGSYAYAGTAEGILLGGGSATGATDFSGTAVGAAAVRGTSTASYAYSGSSSGATTPKATTTSSYLYTGSVTGIKPSVTTTGTGAYLYDGSAIGQVSRAGASTVEYSFTGTATAGVLRDITLDQVTEPVVTWESSAPAAGFYIFDSPVGDDTTAGVLDSHWATAAPASRWATSVLTIGEWTGTPPDNEWEATLPGDHWTTTEPEL